MQVRIPETASITLSGNEKIGWTSETNAGAFSFMYRNQHQTIFRNVQESQGRDVYPEVAGDYTFDTIPLPAVFSLGAVIETGEKLKTFVQRGLNDIKGYK